MDSPQRKLSDPLNFANKELAKVGQSQETGAEAAVKAFIHVLGSGDMEGLPNLFEEHADIIFTEAYMNIREYTEEMVRACKAFPDLSFTWQSVEAIGNDKAILRGLRAKGTHMGPYGFGPYPEVEATQTVCRNDPEEITVWISPNGKIRKALFVPKGPLTGPPGFYEQIGGLIF